MKKKKKNKSFFKKIETSKKLLYLDYIVAGILFIMFIVLAIVNGVYSMNVTNSLIKSGIDISSGIILAPFNLDIFGVLLGSWIIQLGISTGAYYIMCKSDHKMQLPMKLINDLPCEIKDTVDMTQVITSVLSSTNN